MPGCSDHDIGIGDLCFCLSVAEVLTAGTADPIGNIAIFCTSCWLCVHSCQIMRTGFHCAGAAEFYIPARKIPLESRNVPDIRLAVTVCIHYRRVKFQPCPTGIISLQYGQIPHIDFSVTVNITGNTIIYDIFSVDDFKRNIIVLTIIYFIRVIYRRYGIASSFRRIF